jgi:WD40 repeat protein
MDGKTLISGSYYSDHSIRTWNTKTWKHVAVLEGHTDEVYSIVISPNGCILASASRDKTARLWNIENGQPISSPLHHEDMVISVIFSADGKQLATACHDNNAYLWDVSAILHEVGLEDLLLDKQDERDKSVRDTFIKNPLVAFKQIHSRPLM